MKVCDVVLNSVWFDPRVRKQVHEYISNEIELSCVGYKCVKYNEEKLNRFLCPVSLVELDEQYRGKQNSLLKKILREINRTQLLKEAIIAENPDIIHANDLDTLVACCLAAKKLNCKVVYDSHEICVENSHMKGLYKKYFALCEKIFIKKVDKMVCVSHAAADYFEKKYQIERPMVITNCSLKTEQVVGKEKKDDFEVLNHGQYYGGRGYDIMVEAIPYLKDYENVKIAFRGFGKMEEELRARARELGDAKVRFYPPVHVSELISNASSSKVGVAITENICLNFELSVSNKLFEYASAGLPVIMSDIPEHRYLNEKYHFGIVLSENTPQDFANAVIKLYENPEFYEACVNGAKRLTEEVNWETEFQRLIAIEREWINGKK